VPGAVAGGGAGISVGKRGEIAPGGPGKA
jgi:hypothetical protein